MASDFQKPKDSKEKNPKDDGEGVLTIHWRIKEWFKDIDNDKLATLKAYHSELLQANKSLNLIGVKTIAQADAIHFADCITAARQIYKKTGDSEIYDVGSGNGFPGMILAILYPKMRVVMVDSDPRKAEFLKNLSSQLRLSNTNVLSTQAERLEDSVITHAVCRGFSNISRTILAMRKPVKKGGFVYHMKGEEWSTEVADIPTQLCSFWRPALMCEYKLPVGTVNFSIVSTEKIAD